MEQILGILFAGAFGAIFGSYATLFAYRLPRGESCFGRYFGQKSRCPKCHTIIRTRDLIPLLNWIFTLGKCSKCHAKIPRTHLFIEFATTAFFVLFYIKFSFSQEFMIYALISVGAVILLVCDFTHKHFPQPILIFILMISLAGRVLHDGNVIDVIFSASIGVIFATIFYQVFYKKTAGLFATQSQSFDYTKFILISSVQFGLQSFLLYFFAVMLIFTTLLILKIPNKKNRDSFGYSLLVPFLWMMLFYPSFN
ncbi:MAG: A24 family peptidase [Proteobacteria bacterium]|nr:A24 family peptidase [Pseudomonadota bacterium]